LTVVDNKQQNTFHISNSIGTQVYLAPRASSSIYQEQIRLLIPVCESGSS
jgi:hypothetical protein